MTRELGGKVQLVGDDLFDQHRASGKGHPAGCGQRYLIKLNQIGSVSETLKPSKWRTRPATTPSAPTAPARDGDTTIADLAVALNTCQIKTGAPSRTERVAKYNRLLRIEEQLGSAAVYPGMEAF